VELLLACLVSLLPERWRARWAHGSLPFGTATKITAGGQIVGAFFLLGYTVWSHFHVRVDDPDALGFGFGAYWFIVYWLTPRGLLTGWLLVEGVVRFLHSFHDEPLATLPLVLVDGAARLLRRVKPPPPPRPDRVTLEGDALTIAAATPYDWSRVTTVRYAGRLWRVRDTRWAGGAWPHVYELEPAPDEHLIRGIVEYG
jgi:hypothetical protein